ncbi:MAG: FAD-binding oxidoreductase [Rhodobacteraceae bacterium]|nr:FAD-binding oxidoreductase [Paracoccaceae bacterium]
MKYDFLIIGGGIAGVSAAASLSALGSVCMLEAEKHFGYHATGRSAAMFIRDYGNDVVRALNCASAAHLESVDGGVLSPRGLLTLARAGESEGFAADNVALGMEEISVPDAQDILPILNRETVTQASYLAEAPDIDTDKLFQDYLRSARHNGAAVVADAKVSSIIRNGQHWTVETGAVSYSARILVNAAGAWVDEIARLAGVAPLGFLPYRRSMARMRAPGGHDVRHWPMAHGVDDRWYAKPDAGAWIVSPSEEDLMHPHDAYADDMVLAEGLERYQEMVTEEVTRPESTWAGLRTFAPDRTLVVGFEPEVPNFFWLAGQGGYGFQTAPAVSILAAELIAGKPRSLDADTVAALDPGRLRFCG